MQHITALAALLPLVAAHGFVNSPPPREPGDAYKAACGDQPFNQQSADINGNVQGIFQVVGDNFDSANCNLWLCKGFLLEDNPDNLQTYSLGETIDFDVNIAAPHTGYANVSVVKTSSNTIIGEPLIEFSNYAANSGVAANNSAFSVTLPESLGGDCTEAGDCVLQWFWDAPDIDQTYEACVDFVVGSGSGSGSGSSPSAVVSETAAPVETAAETSAAAEETEAATRTAVDIVTSAIVPEVPATSAAEAETTEAPIADDEADEDCEEDEYDEEPVDEADEDCEEDDEATEPVDDAEEDCEEDDGAADYDDEYEDDASSGSSPSAAAVDVSAPAASATKASATRAYTKPTGAANYGSGSKGNSNSGKASTVTSYVTISAETVTVTAPAAACTA